jgi:hypothetical protein
MRIAALVLFGVAATAVLHAQELPAFRPPAVPLVTHNPYFSAWSMSDHLTDSWPRHWSGADVEMSGIVRIDGKAYRFMGPEPASVPAMEQLGVVVWATRTIYQFLGGGVQLSVTFLSPTIPSDPQIFSRPASYITWSARSADGQRHDVTLYFDCAAGWVVSRPDQLVTAAREKLDEMQVLSMGARAQSVLETTGDAARSDWGRLYLASPGNEGASSVIASSAARERFAATGSLPDADHVRLPRAANDDEPALAWRFPFGTVGPEATSRWIVIAYDEDYAVEFLGERLRPYWRESGRMDAKQMLRAAADDYPSISAQARAFDEQLQADLRAAGGDDNYARLAQLAFRQAAAAHVLARDTDGTALLFGRENSSGGYISTVDVIYPCAPYFLLFNPHLLEAQLRPVLEYAGTTHWRFPYAPHDLGKYPLADGQAYGGGETSDKDQMPVEETANMLLMTAALAKIEENADFAKPYWPLLAGWAAYLREKGFDPENQLSTDDFTGHLAHNANLSIKAILALGAFAQLAGATGHAHEAASYRALAAEFAAKWAAMAADGDHSRLAFDAPGTWSQKYNLVWDKILGLNLFAPQIAQREIGFYLTKQNLYGLPLDSRHTYTKLDWLVWTATLSDSRLDFSRMVTRVYNFANETPDRVPLSDWYDTLDARRKGFQARSVVGGVFVKMLANPAVWKKWADRAISPSNP